MKKSFTTPCGNIAEVTVKRDVTIFSCPNFGEMKLRERFENTDEAINHILMNYCRTCCRAVAVQLVEEVRKAVREYLTKGSI